jgi:hypothetical protein
MVIARLLLVLCIVFPQAAAAHCDTLDGPVVAAARDALDTGDFAAIAIWVKAPQEYALQSAFRHTLAVRKLGPEARDLADRYFFETAVRLHRESEGEPYTGLKPAGSGNAAVLAMERALASGDDRALVELLVSQVRAGTNARFRDVAENRVRRRGDIEAGRLYVARYIALVHYVLDVYTASGAPLARPGDPRERHEH